MTNRVQASALDVFLVGGIDVVGDTIKLQPLEASYVYAEAHDFLNDVAAGDRVGSPITITGIAVSDGWVSGDDVTTGALSPGDTVAGYWIFRSTGVESTSDLIAFVDHRADTAAISVDTDGGTITFGFHLGRIFKI